MRTGECVLSLSQPPFFFGVHFFPACRYIHSRNYTHLIYFSLCSNFLYEVGKILVFMTALPKGAAEPSSLGSGVGRARRVQVTVEHIKILQEIKRTIIRHCPQFVPAFLSLILPCLDPTREKSRGDTSALDVVLTLFKQVSSSALSLKPYLCAVL